MVEGAIPGIEVLALELNGNERFCVFVDHPQGVDHALCERVTQVLRPYLDTYCVEVSSPGFDRPLRSKRTSTRAVGRDGAHQDGDRPRPRRGRLAAGERCVPDSARDAASRWTSRTTRSCGPI